MPLFGKVVISSFRAMIDDSQLTIVQSRYGDNAVIEVTQNLTESVKNKITLLFQGTAFVTFT